MATVLVVTVVGIVGLVLAAGTLTDPATTGATSGVGGLDAEQIGYPGEEAAANGAGGSVLGSPPPAIVLAIVLVAAGAVVYATLDDSSGSMRAAIVTAVAMVTAILVVTALFRRIVGQRPTGSGSSINFSALHGSIPGAPGPPGTGATATGLPLEFWAVVGVVGVGAVAAIVVLSGDDAAADEPESERTDQTDAAAAVTAVREAAGRARDRLASGVDVDNAVYAAWAEMVAALDVGDPDTTTPEEFATRAREAGMDPAAVEDLTQLFADVRYGDRPVTDARERRARETLTAIAPGESGDAEE